MKLGNFLQRFQKEEKSQQPRKASVPEEAHKAELAKADVIPAPKESAVLKATCTVWGDPHITVFDNQVNTLGLHHLSLLQNELELLPSDVPSFKAGDCWLVRSEPVQIQGRYNTVDTSNFKKPFLRALAIGGPFLKGNTLVIGTHSTFWNQQEILPEMNTTFDVRNMISAKFTQTLLVQDPSRLSPGITLKLPLDVSLIVNRHKRGLGIAITMPRIQSGQDGQCGNFNGERVDDTAELIGNRMGPEIPEGDILFRNVFH